MRAGYTFADDPAARDRPGAGPCLRVHDQPGSLYKHRGAQHAPALDIRRPLRTARSLLASKWFAIGLAVVIGTGALHIAAQTIVLTGLIANVANIAGGIVVFGDPLPAGTTGLAIECAGFAMVCAAAEQVVRRAGLGGLAVVALIALALLIRRRLARCARPTPDLDAAP